MNQSPNSVLPRLLLNECNLVQEIINHLTNRLIISVTGLDEITCGL